MDVFLIVDMYTINKNMRSVFGTRKWMVLPFVCLFMVLTVVVASGYVFSFAIRRNDSMVKVK